MDESLILRNRVQRTRAEKGLPQSVGTSQNTVSSIETGQFNPTTKLPRILSVALEKKSEALFYFDKLTETSSVSPQ